MDSKKVARINELYKKSKTEGLSEEEKLEQSKLRLEYIEAIRKNMQHTLNNVSVLNPDGTITDLSDRNK